MIVRPNTTDTGSPYPVLITNKVHRIHATDLGERFVAVGRKHESRDPALGAGLDPHGSGTGRKDRGIARWKALRRRKRNLERHPYIIAMRQYLSDTRSAVQPNTLRERESKLLYLFQVLLEFRLDTDPAAIREDHVHALVKWMRDKELSLGYQAKLWQYLRGLLAYVGNDVLGRMTARGQWKPPKTNYSPTVPKDDSWYKDACDRLSKMPGWRPSVVLAATALYLHTGLRPKELRLASIRDLDLQRWTLRVRHPKGEQAWASDGESVRIFNGARPILSRYLELRDVRLKEVGLNPEAVEPLFPNENGEHYSDSGWRMARYKAYEEAGIDGNYKTLRPTFGQRLKDRGASIEAVSKALRHKSVLTTEAFYARIRAEDAWDQLEEAWEKPRSNGSAR